jgi:hypothetical protein
MTAKLRVVRVTIRGGVVVFKDDTVRRAVEALRDPRGLPVRLGPRT